MLSGKVFTPIGHVLFACGHGSHARVIYSLRGRADISISNPRE